MKIKAVKCYQCDAIIYSRCKQDVRACNCFDLDRDKRGPWISIMGGLKDPRISSQHRSCFQIVDIQIEDDIVPFGHIDDGSQYEEEIKKPEWVVEFDHPEYPNF